MSAERLNGRTGRALTAIAATGQVEIDGTSHAAFTAGPPIPPGTEIVVTGWRAEGASGYVLSVRERSVAEAEERARPETPWHNERRELRAEIDWGGLLLTYGQIVSVLGCIGVIVSAIYGMNLAPTVGYMVLVLISGTCAFLYSAAMFVVFSHVKRWRLTKPGS
jgi:hypothetical protein